MDNHTKIRIGIIGNAMRKPTQGLTLDRDLFNKMFSKVETIIIQGLGYTFENVTLVSGGAPWGDHVAVHLHLKYKCKLHLYLPLDPKLFLEREFPKDVSTFPVYHNLFNKKTWINSLRELDTLIKDPNVIIGYGDGYMERNRMLAENIDILIALTLGKNKPNPGGTRNTWNMARCEKKIHISILEL